MNNLKFFLALFLGYKLLTNSQPAEIGMNAFRFIPVFDENGKFNLKFTTERTGVYLIKENDKIVYIGYSNSNLYKTITRHFQEWNDRGRERITYNRYGKNKYTIRVVFAPPTKSLNLEQALVLKYRPRDNQYKLSFLDMEEKEAEKVEQKLEKVLDEYNDQPKYDYPPDWD